VRDEPTPTRFSHYSENVPDELKTGAPAWVCCDEVKVPLVAVTSGACYAASSTDPGTWRDYDTAFASWRENEWSFAGIGRVIKAAEDLVGVDLDKCLSPETGELTPRVSTILERLDSYAEISPSGTGVKIWVRAPSVTRAHVKPGLEIYPRGRYFTVTGVTLGGTTDVIEERGDQLKTIIAEEFPKVDSDRTPYNGPKRVIDLLDYLERAGVEIFSELSDGQAERKYGVLCPWVEEHTDGDESGTYAGQYPDGATFFQCWHAHCAERRWKEFRHHADPLVYLGRRRRSTGRLR
jgi:hypothetical protein